MRTPPRRFRSIRPVRLAPRRRIGCSKAGANGGGCRGEPGSDVSEDLWSERDTNPDAIAEALRDMLRERCAADRGLAPARVLNLIVIVDRDWKGEIANRLERVGRYHASRTILCAVEGTRQTLDAVAVMSYDEPTGSTIGVRRERVAASFDPPLRMAALERITEVSVRHRPSSRASALLLAGWLSSRLSWDPQTLASMDGAGLRGGALRVGGEVQIALEPFAQEAPGLAGVTVSCETGFSLSLDRASGGLRAKERSPDGEERTWQVLGASRGEGGILGEGVRQALLRDPTYGPALDAGRGFCR